MTTTAPLAGIRVLDLSRVLAGPVCCQVLADLGADVVKVERPGSGDDTRQWGPPFAPGEGGTNGPSAYYLSANRGKRGLALDLEHPDARPVLEGLIQAADILVENFLPHTLDKLGLRPERLRRLNPRLVSVSISGFGRTGPLADTPGYDLVIQALAGVMSITGEPAGTPMKIGVAITDVLTGLYAAISSLAGLSARERGQAGRAFDLALTDCTLASLVNVAQGALVTGRRPKRYGNAHPHIVPYEAFATTDGHLVLAVGNDRQWQRFCAAAGLNELAADGRFTTNPLRVQNRDVLIPLLQQRFARDRLGQWCNLLTAADVPHAPVLAVDEGLHADQTVARGLVREASPETYGVPIMTSPIHIDGETLPEALPPPAIGEHSAEVLSDWLGYDAGKIAALLGSGAVA